MSEDLPVQIEQYLATHGGWVSTKELCHVFEINERALRSTGKRPGLCTEFAISGNDGFRHIAHATDSEFQRAYARMRGHGLGELVHARRLKAKRRSILAARATTPPFTFERATGQGVLLVT